MADTGFRFKPSDLTCITCGGALAGQNSNTGLLYVWCTPCNAVWHMDLKLVSTPISRVNGK